MIYHITIVINKEYQFQPVSPNRYSCADHLKLHIQEGITPHKMIIHSKIPKVLTLAIQGQDSNKFTQKKYSWGLNVIEP